MSEREMTFEAIRNAVRSADASGSDTASLQKGHLQFVLGEVARGESRLSAVLEGLQQIEVEYPPEHRWDCELSNAEVIAMEPKTFDAETTYPIRRRTEKDPPARCTCGLDKLLAALRTVGEQRTTEEKR